MKMEKVEEGLRLAVSFMEAFNKRDVKAVAELLAEDCLFESAGPAPLGGRFAGKDAAVAAIGAFFEASPLIRMDSEEIYGMGKRAVLRWIIKGVDGFPEGRRGVDLFTARDGKIAELSAYAKG
jgi:ketosteroid isomerase-like protein